MKRRKHTSPWVPIAMIGGIVGVIALIARSASANETAPPSPLLTPVTDPVEVRRWQTKVAEASQKGALAVIMGISAVDYGPNDVDGNPENPRWKSTLAKIQRFINALLPTLSEKDRAEIPSDYPTQLRTDGVLDNATVIALDHL